MIGDLAEDPAPTDDLGVGEDTELLLADDPTATEEFDTSLEALQELLDAEEAADADPSVESVSIPPVKWAEDKDHPDFAHSIMPIVSGLPLQSRFTFNWDVFDLLVRANSFKPRGKNGLVAFGLRGGKLVGGDLQEGVSDVTIEDARPDHAGFLCTLGIVDTNTKKLRAYPGSTVPNKKWMENYFKLKNGIRPHKSTRSNLMPTGCYVFRVNAHGGGKIKPALRMTDPDNLTADADCTVLRTHNDLTYSHDDFWDKTRPFDNIHCAYADTSFSSAGCQTIKGANGEGPWGAFQDVIGGMGWDARIDYVLLTGREAAIAAALIAAGRADDEARVQSCLGRLRVGSEGERVTALQKKLGFNGSAYFGPSTRKRLVEVEAAEGLNSDGVYSPADDVKTGWSVFRLSDTPVAHTGPVAASAAQAAGTTTLRLTSAPAGAGADENEGSRGAITFRSAEGADALNVTADAALGLSGAEVPVRISASIQGIPSAVRMELRVVATPVAAEEGGSGPTPAVAGASITAEGFDRFAPNARAGYRDAILENGSAVLGRHGIDASPRRLSHFLAQISHESGGFAHRVESLNYTTAERIRNTWPRRFNSVAEADPFVRNERDLAERVYGGRMGNTQPGDGFRYRGRGLIQLTGRKNYADYAERLDVDLVGDPDFAFEPVVALRIAAEFWTQTKLPGERSMNALADDDKLRAITYRINGGFMNFERRESELSKAKSIWVDSNSGAENSGIVDRGDFSDAVRHLQLSLVSLARLGGAVDGKFGHNTYKALFGFKTELGLDGAGFADQATFDALNDADAAEAVPVEDAGLLPMIGDEPEPVRNGVSLWEDKLTS